MFLSGLIHKGTIPIAHYSHYLLHAQLVPEIECQMAPLSINGSIRVSWQFVHTGGLNLTGLSVLYSLDTSSLWFQRLANGKLAVDSAEDPTALSVSDLPAGSRYIFKVASSNELGNSSSTCPPIVHSIGMTLKTLKTSS